MRFRESALPIAIRPTRTSPPTGRRPGANFSACSAAIAPVRRQGGESRVVHRAADGEVVERLELEVPEAEHLVYRVVEEAADAGRAHAGGFGFEIEHLPNEARLPEEAAVERRPVLDQRRLVLGEHAEREGAVAGDVLAAAHLGGEHARVAALEEEERQLRGAAGRRLPREMRVHRAFELLHLCRIARERIQAGLDAVHAMHEKAEVNRRRPGDRIPGHRTLRRRALGPRHDAAEQPVEALARDGGASVAGEQAAPLVDDLPGGDHGFREAAATLSMISQGTGSSRERRFAFPYQRCRLSAWTASISRVETVLAASPGHTAISSSAPSRSAPSKSAARSRPSSASMVSSLTWSSRRADQPSVAAAMRSVPTAWPASCWQ